jgi:hypothetical protein
MPFHVEVRRSFRRAWAFNMDEQKLRRTVVEPWRHGARLELGDQEWDPRECALTILEGPALAPSDLAHGRGWRSAERSARDVTVTVMGAEQLAVAVLAETPEAERRLAEALGALGVPPIDWSALRARVLAAEQPLGAAGAIAVLIVIERGDPPAALLFEAGLALGAFGRRAIVVQISDGAPPPELGDVGVVRLDLQRPASLQALGERLREAGR